MASSRELTLFVYVLYTLFTSNLYAMNEKSSELEKGEEAFRIGDFSGALDVFEPLARKDTAKAQYYLGLIYYRGLGVQFDESVAMQWFSKAAALYRSKSENGDVEAQYMLGEMYLSAEGVDEHEALRWTKEAANAGHILAQYNLALFYRNGIATKEDIDKELGWLKQAANNGLSEAQYELGVMYSTGEGVDVDNEEAVYWYNKAAKQGHASSEYNLGIMMLFGEGVNKDVATALSLITKAAEKGHYDAQKFLVEAYEGGLQGVPVDGQKSKYWRKVIMERNKVP